jgi:hypothetical protein
MNFSLAGEQPERIYRARIAGNIIVFFTYLKIDLKCKKIDKTKNVDAIVIRHINGIHLWINIFYKVNNPLPSLPPWGKEQNLSPLGENERG